jgi:hypothetical protein
VKHRLRKGAITVETIPGQPGVVTITINRVLPLSAAIEIIKILEASKEPT